MAQAPGGRVRHPLLVTGVPRSGTTWLARWLAGGEHMALGGREPMNPREGQYALAHTLTGWTRLVEPTRRQRTALRLAYRGLNPWVFSRYGFRQWAAPLPSTRVVVKDPFALLSLPAVVRHTGAVPVLVYRHPGAVLASYRRMGWSPDIDELRPLVEEAHAQGAHAVPQLPTDPGSGAQAMGLFWAALHELALFDIRSQGVDAVVVAHQELAGSGRAGGRRLADRLGVGWTEEMEHELDRESSGPEAASTSLHNLSRSPAEVAESWRTKLAAEELAEIEEVTERTRAELETQRLVLS